MAVGTFIWGLRVACSWFGATRSEFLYLQFGLDRLQVFQNLFVPSLELRQLGPVVLIHRVRHVQCQE